ncbi:MAG: tetratricopeptide repeat protein [Bacteroidota bacterium]
MLFKKATFLLCLSLCSFLGMAQQTTVFTQANEAYKRGMDFYDKGLFALAQKEFKVAVDLLRPVHESESEFLQKNAKLFYAKSAVRQNMPDGEKLILDFAREYEPEPIATNAILEMGNYYFNAKKYDKVIELFSRVDTYNLSQEQQSEVLFRTGYALFVRKKFNEAKGYFNRVKDYENKYYYPTNYYLGMCAFFQDKYDEAIKSFRRVAKSRKYKPHVPYYITQIHFAQGEYDEVITYANKVLKDKSIKKRAQINQLLGQAYFEKGDYARALPYLEEAASRSRRMRQEDFYQLGFAQYKNGKYAASIKNFEELNRVNSKLGQHAMYLLGDARIKTGDKASARNAFKAASRLDFDPSIKEESLYNYAKLSYELNYDREAVTALQRVPPTSNYYREAQTILSSIFLNTRDYSKALEIIEKMPRQTPEIKETYQKVAYYRGIQLHKEGNYDAAQGYFKKSIQMPIDARTRALATYWLGDIDHQTRNFNGSIAEMNKFLSQAKNLSRLPDESSVYTANYTQGYNYLKQKNYSRALGFFQDAVAGIKRNRMYINNQYVTQNVLGDAVLRAGDCLFKRNKYNDAIKFYNEAVNNKYSGFVYALYQKAIIEGLRGKVTNKIIALESITEEYPRSEYADNALLQLGVTYQEINKLSQSVAPLRMLIDKYPESELYNQALLRLGLISYNQGNTATAINYYKQVFNHNPDATEAQAALAALEEIYVDDMGKPEEYFAFLETIPGYNVGNAEKEEISFKAGESQFENGNYENAISAYTRYLRQYANGRYSLLAHYRRGESYSVLKRYSEALGDYEAIVGRGQSKYYTKALSKAAIISYNYKKDFQKAYNLYRKLEEIAQDETARYEAQLGAMRSAYRSNNTDAVLIMANKVKNNPRASQEQKAAASFYIGKIAFDNKDYDPALQALNDVTRLSDNEQTAEARYLIAYIYYVRRDLEVAQQLCLNANKESSNYPYWIAKSVILLSDVLAEKGDLFNAQAALESLIENYDEDQELVNIAKAKLAQLKNQESASSRLRVDDNSTNSDLELDEIEEEQ